MSNTIIPQHIADKANTMLAKGAQMTFEAICEMYMKSEAKATKNRTSSKEVAKWEARSKEFTGVVRDIAELNRESAMKNLPSSMR